MWRPRVGGPSRLVAAILALLVWGACQVEWGGGRVALEDPAPPPDTTAAEPEDAEPELPPLPVGDLLYLSRSAPDGSARVTPIARLTDGIEPLGIPSPLVELYRARFDSTFLAPGTELELHAHGERIGSLVLGERRPVTDAACPSVARATILLVPGQTIPELGFGLPLRRGAEGPSRALAPETVRSMSVAAPVLAERLMGDERSYLARRVAFKAVRLPPDTAPALAATYLVSDSLMAGPPAGDAISLFYLARWEAARGYVPVWQELRRYATAAQKEVLEHLDWFRTRTARVDLLRRYTGLGVGLAAGAAPLAGPAGERRIDWREPEACPALDRLTGS